MVEKELTQPWLTLLGFFPPSLCPGPFTSQVGQGWRGAPVRCTASGHSACLATALRRSLNSLGYTPGKYKGHLVYGGLAPPFPDPCPHPSASRAWLCPFSPWEHSHQGIGGLPTRSSTLSFLSCQHLKRAGSEALPARQSYEGEGSPV